MIIAFGSKTCKSGKDLQQKQSVVAVRYSGAITAKCPRQKPQGLAAKAIVVFRYSEAITAKCLRQKPQGLVAKAVVSCSLQ